MPAAGETVQVQGLRELNRAFALASRELVTEMNDTLRKVAEPVRSDAEALSTAAIPRIGMQWSRMRVGVTRTSVYVAPRKRGSRDARRKRPNLAGLLLDRAMLPALNRNEHRVTVGVEQLLHKIGRDWERL